VPRDYARLRSQFLISMARILWIACAEPGSLFPAVPIALELTRRGHTLTVLSVPSSQKTFESLGFGFRPARELARHLRTFGFGADESIRDARSAWHAGAVRALYVDAHRELSAAAYDAAMVDPLEPGGGFACEASGIPSFSYVHWHMAEAAVDTWFRFRIWDRTSPGAEAFVEWWNEQRALVGLGPEPRPPQEHVWYRHSRRLTLILGLPELVEPKADLPPYAVRVGPTVWEPPLETALPEWVERLGRERPAVLASVSTVGEADAPLVGAVGDAVGSEDLDVVLTVTAAGALPPLPDNVRVAPFVPHGALLPRVAAVVSHAGNGTVTRAACAGVPLLLLPDGKDQFDVARGAAAAGIALVLDREDADAPRVRTALRKLLDRREFRTRAHQLAQRAARYDAAATAADAAERFLASRFAAIDAAASSR
jgi:UDP:flavonoid glycosyltransferase YjiC (YdhE family)